MKKTGLVYHRDYLKSDAGPFHPEGAARIKHTMEHLEKTGLLSKLRVLTPKKCSEKDILRVHTRELLERIKDMSASGGGFISEDTYCGPETYEVARLAAGGCMLAGEAVIKGEVVNAYALIRPPGHHASRNKSEGFCIFNNAAVMIRYLQHKYGLKKIFLFDWDAHAANGTMDIFYDDPSVLNVSVHQDPRGFYPHTCFIHQIGRGLGEGFTVNIPVAAGSGDADYIYLLKEFVLPLIESYKPELIVVCAGQDSHGEDSMSELSLTENGYYEMTHLLVEAAERVCGGRLVAELEGGYELSSFARSNQAIIEALMKTGRSRYKVEGEVSEQTEEVLFKLRDLLLDEVRAFKTP